jgi:hypothetical protein
MNVIDGLLAVAHLTPVLFVISIAFSHGRQNPIPEREHDSIGICLQACDAMELVVISLDDDD